MTARAVHLQTHNFNQYFLTIMNDDFITVGNVSFQRSMCADIPSAIQTIALQIQIIHTLENELESMTETNKLLTQRLEVMGSYIKQLESLIKPK